MSREANSWGVWVGWKGSCGVLAPETWALYISSHSSDSVAFIICGGQPATEIPNLPTHAGSR